MAKSIRLDLAILALAASYGLCHSSVYAAAAPFRQTELYTKEGGENVNKATARLTLSLLSRLWLYHH